MLSRKNKIEVNGAVVMADWLAFRISELKTKDARKRSMYKLWSQLQTIREACGLE